MANEIKVTVTGEDKLTAVSKKATDSAKKDADDLAKGWERSGEKIEQAAQEAGRGISSSMDTAGRKASAAMGELAGDADRSFREMAQDADRESSKIDSHYGSAFDGVRGKVSGLASHLSTALSTATGMLIATGISKVSSELGGFIGGSVDAASELADSMNAVNRVFGPEAENVLRWGDNVANMFGLSQRAFNQLAVPLGAMLKNSGLGMQDVAANAIDLTKRAADMASVFGGPVEEAMQAIQAGLRGEADPLERYGVGLSAAAVEAHALAMGLGRAEVDMEKVHVATLRSQIAQVEYNKEVAKTGRGSLEAAKKEAALISANEALEKAMAGGKVELSDQEKMLARISLLMQQTADSAGDHTAASDEHANAIKNDNAKMEEQQALLGKALIPLSMKASEVKLQLAEALVKHGIPAFEKFQAIVGEHVVPRIRELVEWVREKGIPALQEFGGWVGEHVVPRLQALGSWLRDEGLPAAREFGDWFREHMAPNLEKVRDILADLVPKFREMGDTLVEKFQEVKPELKAFAEFMMDKVIPAVLFLVDKITLLLVPAFKAIMESYALTIHAAGDVVSWFRTIGSTAADVATTLSGVFVEAFNTVIRLWNGLEFTLPGGVVGTALFGPLAGKTFGTPDVGMFRTGDTTGGDKQWGGGGVRRMAAGGITNGPMLALIGDNPGGREAVIPLGPGQNSVGGTVINIGVHALDAATAAEGVSRALQDAYRRGLLPRPA